MNKLALLGGDPVREKLLPNAVHTVDEEDIEQVTNCLRSSFLTCGDRVGQFEHAISDYTGASYCSVVSSGTAALHAAMFAIDLQPGDEVIVPAITFVATANCICYFKAKPVFADVDESTLLIDCDDIEARITEKTKAIIAVDYAGQTCDYDRLQLIAKQYGLVVVADACHALGAEYNHRKAGSLADITIFSFHPAKLITSGEGGAVCCDDSRYASRVRQFRSHGINADAKHRQLTNTFEYDMEFLGFNYRITDIQCALGMSQLKKLNRWVDNRNSIAQSYHTKLEKLQGIEPLVHLNNCLHAHHLFVVKFDVDRLQLNRDTLFRAYRAEGVGVNVHYKPVYWHSFYRKTFGYSNGLCPVAEKVYGKILSLPMFASLQDSDINDVTEVSEKVISQAQQLKIYQANQA